MNPSLRANVLALAAASAVCLVAESATAQQQDRQRQQEQEQEQEQRQATVSFPDATPPKPSRGRYTLPFALRPAIAPNVLRVDAAYALHDKGTVTASTVTGGFKVAPDTGIYLKEAFVYNVPDGAANAAAIGNPSLFVLHTPEIFPKVRLALFGSAAVPIGMGGGNVARADAVRAAIGSGVYARQAMDNALFGTNYLTLATGFDVAWIDHGFTLQAEATVLYLIRTRGESLDAESSKTNFTSGAHAGYLIADFVNVGIEAHYQRWLSTPLVVERDAAYRDQATVGGGVRFNVPLGRSVLARPGLAYFHPIDDPMAKAGYRIVQLDLPFVF